MIVVKFMGGLGNQMFQYAFGKAMSLKYNTDLFFDLEFFNDVKNGRDKISTVREFELSIFKNITVNSVHTLTKRKLIGNKFLNILKYKLGIKRKHFYEENNFSFNHEVNKITLPVYLLGYWQSSTYFSTISDSLRTDFKFDDENSGIENTSLLNKIRSSDSSVSIHIRRGDYLSTTYAVSSVEYYRDAINIIKKNVNDPCYYLFSDDPEWVKDNISPLVEKSILVDWNRYENSWKDMMLMSNCSHHIIANSSFSWWSAWLGSNSNKLVIAPRKWFLDITIDTSDLYLEGWTIL